MSTAAVVVPNRHQVLDSMRRAQPSLRVYYPGDEFLVTEYCGVIRWLTPDLDGEILKHPATGEDIVCDGETAIGARIGKERTRGGVTDVLAEPAEEIVSFLISTEGFGKVGVVALLNDDPEESAKLKKEAKRRYFTTRRVAAEAEWQKRLDFMRRWQDDPRNRHRTAPPPTPLQKRAIKFLMALNEGLEGNRFVSPDGTYQTESWGDFKKYMKQFHNKDVKREDYDTAIPAGRSTAPDPFAETDPELDGAGDRIVTVSGGSGKAALEGHAEEVAETPGPKVPKPPRRKKGPSRGRGGARASHRRTRD